MSGSRQHHRRSAPAAAGRTAGRNRRAQVAGLIHQHQLPGIGAGGGDFVPQLPAWISIDDGFVGNSTYRDPSGEGDRALAFNTSIDWPQAAASSTAKQVPPGGLFNLDYLSLDVGISLAGGLVPETLNTARAGTCSPPSSVSQISSAGSLFSPGNTERGFDGQTLDGQTIDGQTFDVHTLASTWSRGPSPLRQTIAPPPADVLPSATQGDFVCLGPQCEQTFASEDELQAHVAAVHSHACSWAGCKHPGFASRDALIWHVKVEHLIICPAPGCTEMSFQAKNLLESHIRVAHPENWKVHSPKTTKIVTSQAQPMLPARSSQGMDGAATPKPCTPRNADEDRKLREYAVTVSKRKCREQLRSVMEKKARKNAGMLAGEHSVTPTC
jgi:hypothetical protein